MNLLILHHIDPEFDIFVENLYTGGWTQYIQDVIAYISNNNFSHICLTRPFNFTITEQDPPEYQTLKHFINTIHEYPWGWSHDDYIINPDSFIKGNGHSEFIWIDDWINNIPYEYKHVTFIGMFEQECLLDMEGILKYLGVPFSKYKPLCIGPVGQEVG